MSSQELVLNHKVESDKYKRKTTVKGLYEVTWKDKNTYKNIVKRYFDKHNDIFLQPHIDSLSGGY